MGNIQVQAHPTSTSVAATPDPSTDSSQGLGAGTYYVTGTANGEGRTGMVVECRIMALLGDVVLSTPGQADIGSSGPGNDIGLTTIVTTAVVHTLDHDQVWMACEDEFDITINNVLQPHTMISNALMTLTRVDRSSEGQNASAVGAAS
jgi:hypothetical protein